MFYDQNQGLIFVKVLSTNFEIDRNHLREIFYVIVNDFSLEARIGHDGPIDLNGLTIKLCGQGLGHIRGNTVLPSPDPVNMGRMP